MWLLHGSLILASCPSFVLKWKKVGYPLLASSKDVPSLFFYTWPKAENGLLPLIVLLSHVRLAKTVSICYTWNQNISQTLNWYMIGKKATWHIYKNTVFCIEVILETAVIKKKTALPHISQVIQKRRIRNFGYSCESKKKLIGYILLWTPMQRLSFIQISWNILILSF